MMAYRSSVHKSTGYRPQFLVFGQALILPLDCIYLDPQENETPDIHDFVHNKQQAFQRAFELVQRNLNEKKKANCYIQQKGPRHNIQRSTKSVALSSGHRC